MNANNNIEGNNIENEKDKKMTRYYRSYREALQHSRAGDVILFDPMVGQYYIIRPGQRNIFPRF